MFAKLKNLPQNIKALGWVSFFTDMSSDMIFPVLPIYLRSVLGINEATIGLIEGVSNSTAEIIKVFSGEISDYLKKRKLIIFSGYLLSTIAKPLFAFANTWPIAFAARLLDRTGKGIRGAPKNALVSQSSEKANMGVSFGFDSTLDTLGAVAGTLLLFILLNYFKFRFQSVFFLSFIPASVALLIIIFKVKDIPPSATEKTETLPQDKIKFGLKVFSELPRKYYIFLVISSIFALGNISYTFLVLKASDLGLSSNYVPLFYFLYSVVYAMFSLPMGTLADKIGRSTVVLFGYISFGLICVLSILNFGIWVLLPVFLFYGIFLACNDAAGRAMVAALSPENYKGTSIGLYQTTNGVMMLLANVIFGILWTGFGSNVAFGFSLICTTISIALLSGYKVLKFT